MKTPFAALARLAWRESRTTRRRLLLYMGSISLGVAALVAIDSFAANVTESVREQARSLLGGDLAFTSRGPLPAAAATVIDSLRGSTARVTSFASMAVDRRTDRTRLVQVRAISAGYPLYGHVDTDPAGAWSRERADAVAIVDPSLLVALDARIGDTLALGLGRFEIAATIRAVPGDAAITATIGPRVFIPESYLPITQLLTFGSRAEYKTVIALAQRSATATLETRLRQRFDTMHVRVQSATDTNTGLTDAVKWLRSFLGIVGLVSILLGGIGVASGVRAFVRRKIETVAVLRCLGATTRQVLAIYVAQATAMGFVGALAGAAIGVALQYGLPTLIHDFLPVDVTPLPVPTAIGTGLLIGVWVAFWFAVRPLLALRDVSPLQALRREYGDVRERRAWTPMLVLAVTVAALAIIRAPRPRLGVGMAVGIALVLATLWTGAALLSWLSRRAVRSRWPYVIRQGVANLYRPANQTRSVVLSLGFGAFLIATLYLVQTNVMNHLAIASDNSRGNVLFFDVQQDQANGVESAIRATGHPPVERAPLVTMRIAAIDGVPSTTLQHEKRRANWALRREYRSTYRDTLVSSEHIVAGRWFSHQKSDTAEVSLEADVAKELGLKLGSVITWDVQGVPIPTRLTSTRDVDWMRFEPNFFAVFPSGVLEHAPQQAVILANVPNPQSLSELQRTVVDHYPNVSSIDLSLIHETVGRIVSKVTFAVRFMALFTLALAIPVLFSAVASSRRDRIREGVLLKTLGARRAQIRAIMVAEYAALGTVGALTGVLLSFAAAWALVHFTFETQFVVTIGPPIAIAVGCALLAIAIGLLGGRDVFAQTPMDALRAD